MVTVDWVAWTARAARALDLTAGASLEDWVGLFAAGGTYEDPVNPCTTDVGSIHLLTKATLPDWRSTILSVTGDSTTGAFEWVGEATVGHRRVRMTGCTIVEVDDAGLATRWRDYFDMKDFEAQLRSGG